MAIMLDGVNMTQKYPNAVRGYPSADRHPAFEFSEHVKLDGSSTQWQEEMVKAKTKILAAKERLTPFLDTPIPQQAADMALPQNQGLADALRGARKMVEAGPDEYPHFSPDGKIFPAHENLLADWHVRKVGEQLAMVKEPFAQVHLDTIVFRIDRKNMNQMHALAVDDAITATREFNKLLTYKDSPLGRPDVPKAIEKLDHSLGILDKAIENQTTSSSVLNRINNRIWQMSPGQAKAAALGAIGGAALVAGTTAYAVAYHDD